MCSSDLPVEGFLSREPAAYFHQGEKVFRLALAARGVELGAVQVELVEVGLDFLTVGDERCELVAVKAAPLEESHRAFMHKVHGPGIDGDTGRAERSDGCGGSIEAHEMHIDIAVVFEGCGDRQAGGEGPAEAVDKDVDLLSLVLGEFAVNGRAVEVVSSDVSFE